MRILLMVGLCIILSGCTNRVSVDFTSGPVTSCTNKYDIKDDIIFYNSDKSEHVSPFTGVPQTTIVDIFDDRHMLNVYELDNYVCIPVTNNEQINSILND